MKQHANGQALRQADNIKEKDANVYLTHTLTPLRMTPLRACSIIWSTIYLHESEQSDEKRRSKDFV